MPSSSADTEEGAQPGAVVDVVGAKAGANQLLEQVGFFVAALGRTKTRQRVLAMGVPDVAQAPTGEFERLFPTGFAEHVHDAVGVHGEVPRFGGIGTADQRPGQAVRVVDIVKAIAAFDAQAAMVGGAVAPLDKGDFVFAYIEGELTAHAAKRTDRIHLAIGLGQGHVTRGHQGAGRTGLHAFAASHTGRVAHGIVHVKDNLGVVAAHGQADHVVDLLFTAGAQAARALDAGIQVDGNARMGEV